MKIYIILVSHEARIELREQENIISSTSFVVDNNLSSRLLFEIDALLKKNGYDPLMVEDIECSAHDAGFTTERIAQTVVQTYRYVLKNKGKDESS